jgi:pSer/pThr/pTyr-binding forkhead associated (FHA) protein
VRNAVVISSLRGLAFAFPQKQASIAELLALAHLEFRKLGGTNELEILDPALEAKLDQAAAQSFLKLPANQREQIKNLLNKFNLLSDDNRQQFGLQIIRDAYSAFVGSIPFREIAQSFAQTPNPTAPPPMVPRPAPSDPMLNNIFGMKLSIMSEGLDSAKPSELTVHVIEGPHEGLSTTFSNRCLIFLGRSQHPGDRAQLVLSEDPTVSRNHCLIEFHPPDCVVRDLSRNGILVDNNKVDTFAALNINSKLKLGQTVITVDFESVTGEDAVELECMECGEHFYHGSNDQTMEINRPVCAACLGRNQFASQPLPGVEILSTLGEDELGKVYLGRLVQNSELVAVKTMRPELAMDSRKMAAFLAEARRGANFKHPFSIRLFDGGFAAGVFYFLVEYLNGVDAETAIIQRKHPFCWEDTYKIFYQIATAIESAHKQGLIHRDIKPSNILLSQTAQGDQTAKINNFGLLKCFEDTGLSFLSRSGKDRKRPSYMSPEQIENVMPTGPQADIYSLGATFHYLLTGKDPFDFSKNHFTIVIMEHPPLALDVKLPGAPAGLAKIISKCMEKNPTRRFSTVTELLAALNKIAPTPTFH